MTNQIKFIKIIIFLFLLLGSMGTKPQIVEDQFDTTYTGGLSARTLPYYSLYQTFTAGFTGGLTRIEIGFCNHILGSATIEVYEDSGLTGNMLFTSQVNVNTPIYHCMFSFPINCSVVAGRVYTFHFIPGIGFPDPYCLQTDISNSYSGGELYGVDSGGYSPFNMDLVFVTYVKASSTFTGSIETEVKNLYLLKGNSIILSENVIGNLYASNGQELALNDLKTGIYFLITYYLGNYYSFKIIIP